MFSETTYEGYLFLVVLCKPSARTLSPPNVANEPRAAVTGSHKTVGRAGSICVLDGRSNERSPERTPQKSRTFDQPAKRRVAEGKTRHGGN